EFGELFLKLQQLNNVGAVLLDDPHQRQQIFLLRYSEIVSVTARGAGPGQGYDSPQQIIRRIEANIECRQTQRGIEERHASLAFGRWIIGDIGVLVFTGDSILEGQHRDELLQRNRRLQVTFQSRKNTVVTTFKARESATREIPQTDWHVELEPLIRNPHAVEVLAQPFH